MYCYQLEIHHLMDCSFEFILLIIISFPFRVEILKKEQRLHAAWTTCISRLRRDLRDGFEESLISFCCVYLEAYVSSWEIICKNRNRSSPVCTQLLAIGTTIACSIMPFDDCHVSSFSLKRYVRFARWHCHLFTAPPRQKSWVTVIIRGGANNFFKIKKKSLSAPTTLAKYIGLNLWLKPEYIHVISGAN